MWVVCVIDFKLNLNSSTHEFTTFELFNNWMLNDTKSKQLIHS